MGTMDCEAKPKKRKRMESQASNISTQTQMTEISTDSNALSDTNSYHMKTNTSQTDLRLNNPRIRTSERQFDLIVDGHGNRFFVGDDSPPTEVKFPRRMRRNTEQSVNTQAKVLYNSQEFRDFHKCNTTSCIQDCSAQQRVLNNPPQSSTQNGLNYGPPVCYDNNSCCPAPLRQTNRSQSVGTVEHTYTSLVDTVVTSRNGGISTNIVPNGIGMRRRSSIDLQVAYATSRDPSSGYVRGIEIGQSSFCCCLSGNHSAELKFFKTGFRMLFVLNVLVILICATGLPIAYHFANRDKSCIEKEDIQDLTKKEHALFQENPSGKYCPDYMRMAREVEAKKASVTNLESQVDELKKRRSNQLDEISRLLEDQVRNMTTMQSKIDNLQLNVEAKKASVTNLESQVDELKKRRSNQLDEISRLLEDQVRNMTTMQSKIDNLQLNVTELKRTGMCNPAMEIIGKWKTKNNFIWKAERKGCGFELLDDGKIQIEESGTYFIYSIFSTELLRKEQAYPLSHRLYINEKKRLFENVTQHCRSNNGSCIHNSMLLKIINFKIGNRIRVEVHNGTHLNPIEGHKFGLFKV